MHDNIRAIYYRRHCRVIVTLALAAVTVAAAGASLMNVSRASTSTSSIDPEVNVLPPRPEIARELRIEQTPRGGEHLEFSARLTEDGGIIQRPISWKLQDMEGQNVFEGSTPVASLPAPPGEYFIEARYGAVHAVQPVTLLPGQNIGVTLILNVGGVRILPRLERIGLPPLPTLTLVYATTGPDQGKLVTVSEEPGTIMRLGAGNYRVESRFTPGNAIASAEIVVKAGLLTSIEIDHHAGIVQLPLAGGDAPVSWVITDEAGREMLVNRPEVVLTSGSYVARARTGDVSRMIHFQIQPGDRIDLGSH